MKATPIPPRPKLTGILLELTIEEARSLLAITGKIGGSPIFSRRKHFDGFAVALNGIEGLEKPHNVFDESHTGVWFKNESSI